MSTLREINSLQLLYDGIEIVGFTLFNRPLTPTQLDELTLLLCNYMEEAAQDEAA